MTYRLGIHQHAREPFLRMVDNLPRLPTAAHQASRHWGLAHSGLLLSARMECTPKQMRCATQLPSPRGHRSPWPNYPTTIASPPIRYLELAESTTRAHTLTRALPASSSTMVIPNSWRKLRRHGGWVGPMQPIRTLVLRQRPAGLHVLLDPVLSTLASQAPACPILACAPAPLTLAGLILLHPAARSYSYPAFFSVYACGQCEHDNDKAPFLSSLLFCFVSIFCTSTNVGRPGRA